jgi:hypothetical protein
MNLLKSFKATTGLEPGKAHIYDKIFPLPFDNFIILDTQSVDANKNYLFWFRVIELIEPILKQNDINIIHFIEDKKYHFNHTYIDNSIHLAQKTYLLKKAKLFCGATKIYSLICSEFNINQCYLKYDYYMDNTLVDEDSIINSNSKRKNFVNPNGANINNIRPEEIAKKIIKSLFNYEPEFDNTISVGRVYATQSIEIIPDNVFNIKADGKNEIVIRMDYLFSEENLNNQLQSLAASVVTHKPINKNILRNHKKNIKKIYYRIEKNSDSEFISTLHSLDIDFDLITSLSGEDLDKEKIKYMDFKKINRLNILDLEFLDGLDKSKVYFKGNKIVVKSGKTFCSRWHAKVSMNHPNVREAQSALPSVIDESFKEEADYFYFLTKEQL